MTLSQSPSRRRRLDCPHDSEPDGLLTYLFTEVLDGRNAHLADGVQRALGRPARDFAGYAAATAATGVWEPGPASDVTLAAGR